MTLKRTPLFDCHQEAGAKIVPFAGYEMPVRYTSDKKEHMSVREHVGLFDVSHMGEVFIEGPEALDTVQMLFSNDAQKLSDGTSMYTGMLNAKGCFVDDCIVYRFREDKYLVCVNASNREKDVVHIRAVAKDFDVAVRDESEDWVQIAVQGPKARELVAEFASKSAEIRPFTFAELNLSLDDKNMVKTLVARTGYTGEDGFELYVKNADGKAVWNALLDKGAKHNVACCGLGARDTLRLEAALRLYGNDIDEVHTPYEAGLSWTVKLDSGDFVGRAALLAQKESGIPKRMRGFKMHGRGIPRGGYEVQSTSGKVIGVITSGTQAPYLNAPIAMGYVDTEHAAFGSRVHVMIRDKPVEAELVKLPFYKRDEK